MLGCENTVIEGVDWHGEYAGDGAGERQLMVTVQLSPGSGDFCEPVVVTVRQGWAAIASVM